MKSSESNMIDLEKYCKQYSTIAPRLLERVFTRDIKPVSKPEEEDNNQENLQPKNIETDKTKKNPECDAIFDGYDQKNNSNIQTKFKDEVLNRKKFIKPEKTLIPKNEMIKIVDDLCGDIPNDIDVESKFKYEVLNRKTIIKPKDEWIGCIKNQLKFDGKLSACDGDNYTLIQIASIIDKLHKDQKHLVDLFGETTNYIINITKSGYEKSLIVIDDIVKQLTIEQNRLSGGDGVHCKLCFDNRIDCLIDSCGYTICRRCANILLSNRTNANCPFCGTTFNETNHMIYLYVNLLTYTKYADEHINDICI